MLFIIAPDLRVFLAVLVPVLLHFFLLATGSRTRQCEDYVEEWFAIPGSKPNPGFRDAGLKCPAIPMFLLDWNALTQNRLTQQAMVPIYAAGRVALDSVAALDRTQVSAASLDEHIVKHESLLWDRNMSVFTASQNT